MKITPFLPKFYHKRAALSEPFFVSTLLFSGRGFLRSAEKALLAFVL